MNTLRYTVVPAPIHGKKSKDAKTTEDRFALAMADILNEMAADGWHYVRAETLPCEERKGLTGKATVFQNILIFARHEGDAVAEPAPVEAHEDVPTDEEDASTDMEEEERAPVLLTDRAEDHDTPPPLGGARRDN